MNSDEKAMRYVSASSPEGSRQRWPPWTATNGLCDPKISSRADLSGVSRGWLAY